MKSHLLAFSVTKQSSGMLISSGLTCQFILDFQKVSRKGPQPCAPSTSGPPAPISFCESCPHLDLCVKATRVSTGPALGLLSKFYLDLYLNLGPSSSIDAES